MDIGVGLMDRSSMKKRFVKKHSGKNMNCFYYLPTIIKTNYKQNTWNSQTHSYVFGFLNYYYQIDITEVNREISIAVDDGLIGSAAEILEKYGYFISDTAGLRDFLICNQHLIILLKNTPINHEYLQEAFMNMIRYQNFIKSKKGIDEFQS